jgi:hypothetical protein
MQRTRENLAKSFFFKKKSAHGRISDCCFFLKKESPSLCNHVKVGVKGREYFLPVAGGMVVRNNSSA